jgi:hypothetical protein
MRTITTVFAVHNHQPVGNFPEVFEEACQRSSPPFLEVFKRHPEFIERMKTIVHRGQITKLTEGEGPRW